MKHKRYFLLFIMILQYLQFSFAQGFRLSEGLYRMPYEDGTEFVVTNDVNNHNPLGKIDMIATQADRKVVAASHGWVRGIQESYDISCYAPNSCCWEFNNYVVIEHPNGEWSSYVHMKQNSVSGQGIALDHWVIAGTPIGVEGNVGCSSERHLHFEVAKPNDPNNAFEPIGGILIGELLNPVICGTGLTTHFFEKNITFTSAPCFDECPNDELVFPLYYGSEKFVVRGDNSVYNSGSGPVYFDVGAIIQFRAGLHISLKPGFTVVEGARFQTVLRNCNEHN